MEEHPRLMVILARRGFVDPGQAAVFADDLGHTRGDGCFDATLVRTDDTGGSATPLGGPGRPAAGALEPAR